MPDIAVITFHGMGETKRNYAYELFSRLENKLSPETLANIHFDSVYYQDILQTNQERYFDEAKDLIDWKKLRRFMLYGFCDASSLETMKDKDNSPYLVSQRRIFDALSLAYDVVGKDGKVVLLAQSLGGQVISNYLWDAGKYKAVEAHPNYGVWAEQHLDPTLSKDKEAFLKGGSVKYLVTTGCNIPLFVAGRDKEDISPISRPSTGFKWENYYDEDDILGWPLEPLSSAYKRLVTDHPINSGGILTSWNPLSHNQYWTDTTFLNAFVRILESL